MPGCQRARSGVRQQWIDLEGEGLPGLLSEEDGAWLYKRNLGDARFGPARQIAQRPSTAEPEGAGQAMLVLAGAERPSLVDVRPGLQGYSERTADGRRPFRPFRSFPTAAFASVSLRMIDLTGDGNPDLLECGDGMRWYPAIAGEGFGQARVIAEPDAADDRPTTAFSRAADAIRVADMTGDGLADLVQVDNGRVRYWPNLGHGRFAAQVTMANGPVFDRMEDFDEGRIRLADVDGSATTTSSLSVATASGCGGTNPAMAGPRHMSSGGSRTQPTRRSSRSSTCSEAGPRRLSGRRQRPVARARRAT